MRKTYTQAEVDALIAVAYRAAAHEVRVGVVHLGGGHAEAILALTTADARAELDRMLAEAREQGRVEESYTRDHQSAKFEAALIAAREQGRVEEREECARECDQMVDTEPVGVDGWPLSRCPEPSDASETARELAAHIRARGGK